MTANIKIILEGIDKASPVANQIEQSFEGALEQIHNDALNLGDTFDRVGEDIVDAMEDAADKIADTFSDLQKKLDKTSGSSKSGLGSYAGLIAGPVGIIASSLLKGVGFVTNVVSGVASGVVSVVGTVLSTLTSVVVGAFKLAFTAALGAVKFVLSGISTVIRGAFSGLGAILDVVVLGPFKLIFNKVTAIAGGIGVAFATKLAATMQDERTKIVALFEPGEITEELERYLQRSAEDIRASTGAPTRAVMTVMKNAVSGGIKEGLKEFGDLVTMFAGLDDVEMAGQAAKLFARTMRTFNLDVVGLQRALDMVSVSWEKGIIEPTDYIMNMGKVVGSVAYLYKDWAKGFAEIGAAVSMLTTAGGLEPSMAFTSLSAIMMMFSRGIDMWPEAAQKSWKDLGMELKNAKGEFVGLEDIFDQFKRKHATEGDIANIFFGSQEAAKGIMGLIPNIKEYGGLVEGILTRQNVLFAKNEQRAKSVTRQFDMMIGNFLNVFSTFFYSFEEDIGKIFKYIGELFSNITELLREWEDSQGPERLKEGLKSLGTEAASLLPSFETLKGILSTIFEGGIKGVAVLVGEFDVLKDAVHSFFTGGDVDLSESALFHGANILFQGMKALALDAIDLIKVAFKSLGDADFLGPFLDRFGVVIDLLKLKFSEMFAILGADFSNMINVLAIKAKHPLTAIFGDVLGYYGEEQRAAANKYADALREIRDLYPELGAALERQLGTGEGLRPWPDINIPIGIDAGESKAALRDILSDRAREGEEWAREFSERMSKYMAGPADAAASIFTAIGELIPSTADMAAPDYSETIEKIRLWREQIKLKQMAYATVASEMKNVASLQVQASGETLETDKSLIDIAVDLREQMLQYIREQRALRSKIERLEASMGR